MNILVHLKIQIRSMSNLNSIPIDYFLGYSYFRTFNLSLEFDERVLNKTCFVPKYLRSLLEIHFMKIDSFDR